MYARSSTLGILVAMALSLPSNPEPSFVLGATGAITLAVAGAEAQYGLTPATEEMQPQLMISLGATSAVGSLMLYLPGDRLPLKGRYPIRFAWDQKSGELAIHACFVAGSPEQPLGWFHGESGWVTITAAKPGRMAGEFEIEARGFLTDSPDDENRWVTVRGTFEAHGDSTIATIESASRAVN